MIRRYKVYITIIRHPTIMMLKLSDSLFYNSMFFVNKLSVSMLRHGCFPFYAGLFIYIYTSCSYVMLMHKWA